MNNKYKKLHGNCKKVQLDNLLILGSLNDAALFLNTSISTVYRAIKKGVYKQHIIKFIEKDKDV